MEAEILINSVNSLSAAIKDLEHKIAEPQITLPLSNYNFLSKQVEAARQNAKEKEVLFMYINLLLTDGMETADEFLKNLNLKLVREDENKLTLKNIKI
jgi:hypothetical protein